MINVFLSWSGDSSKSAAQVFRAWLPTVIQSARPYMSAEDIDKGQRWSIDLAKQLDDANFGIICLTPDNTTAPWILFEAGAISKSVGRSRVSPLLFGLNFSDLRSTSPLLQFQSTKFDKEEILKLLHSITKASPETERLQNEVLTKTFERSWADLNREITEIDFGLAVKAPSPQPYADKIGNILEELLSTSRTQLNLLRSMEGEGGSDDLEELRERASLLGYIEKMEGEGGSDDLEELRERASLLGYIEKMEGEGGSDDLEELRERASLLGAIEKLEADVGSGDIEELRERVALLTKLAARVSPR